MNNPPKTDSSAGKFERTIEELFVMSLEITKLHHNEGGELRIEYDDALGYPTLIFWDNQSGSHSAGVLEFRDLKLELDGD